MSPRTPLLVVAISLLTVTILGGAGCGAEEPAVNNGAPAVLTIEQALAEDPGVRLKVRGVVVATDTGVVLASTLLKSYPPQAGGAVLPLDGLDIASLVALNSTAGEPEMAQVAWSEHEVTLEGVIEDGTLRVESTPRVIEANSGGLVLRFSPVSEPVATGDTIWWAFDVKNSGTMALDLVFTSGQRGEVVFARDGVEKYRWSAGRGFTQAIETVALQPGEVLRIVLNDVLAAEPGGYDLTASITAAVAPAGGTDGGVGAALPELKTSITVH